MISKFKFTDKEKEELLSSIVVIVDTREKENQHILEWFDKKKIIYMKRSLSQGDYSFYIPKNETLSIPRDLYFDKIVTIERKQSLEELSNNFAQQRDRFEKELSIYKGKINLLIENANYQDICLGNYKTDYNRKSFLATLHSFEHRYNLSIMFMPDNKVSGLYIYYTFYYYLRNILN
jgi:ERCC4-type nuclease